MSSNAVQTARIVTPQSKTDPDDVKVEEIPLPPPELWAELDNSAAPELLKSALPPEPPATDAAVGAIEELDFVDEGHRRIVPLKHKFRRNGTLVSEVIVQRLRIGDVDEIIKKSGRGEITTFDIYAQMTGLPTPVLRGLIDVDGDAVVDAAYDFLPRALKAEPGSTDS